jgi:Ca2+-binding RTX toxin-like protein
MTIIDVKASKSTAEAPSGRQRYEVDSIAPTSATPFYAGVMLSAMMLYFKSVYNAWAEPVQHELPHQPQEPEAAPDGQDISATSSAQDGAQDQQAADDANIVNSRFAAVKAAMFRSKPTMPEEARINLNEAGLEMKQQGDGLEARSMMSQGTAVSFSVMPSNDNRLGSGTATEEQDVSGGSSPAPQLAPIGGDDAPPLAEPVARNPYASGGETPAPVPASNGTRNNLGHQGSYANRKPVAQQQVTLYDQFASTAVVIALADLLRDVTDADGDALSITNVSSSSGELKLVDGGYSFVTDKAGKITITYDVTDGKDVIHQTATFNVVEGTAASADRLAAAPAPEDSADGGAVAMATMAPGSALADVIGSNLLLGTDGDDVIVGTDANDIIYGGLGNDMITGGLGDDELYGEAGNDTVSGGAGNDYLSGGEGNDVLDGGTGVDYVSGGAGDDLIIGAVDGSNDTYEGGEGVDVLDYTGSASDLTFDLLVGQVRVGSSTETDLFNSIESFNGGSGNDHFKAAIGQDTSLLVVTATTGDQTFSGGAGIDSLSYGEARQSVQVDLTTGRASGREIGTDRFSGIEKFETGSGNDTIVAVVAQPEAASPARIVETTTTGNESFDGGAGIDTVDYSNAAQDITVDVASGTAVGVEIGTDTHTDIEVFETGAGDDVFVAAVAQAETAPVVETTTTADQTFSGGTGTDTLDYSNAVQDITVDVVSGTATGAEIGTDTLTSIEVFETGAGDDVFVAAVAQAETAPVVETTTTADQTFVGGAGNDTLDYGSATQALVIDAEAGQASGVEIGTDTFSGIETLIAGSGNDTFRAAIETLAPVMEEPSNTYVGGEGVDTIDYSATEAGILVDVAAQTVSGAEIGTDSVDSVETFIGGSGNDRFEAAGLGLITLVAAASNAVLPEEIIPSDTADASTATSDAPVEDIAAVSELTPDLVDLAIAADEADAAVDAAVQNLTQVLVDAVAEGSTQLEIADAVAVAAAEIEQLEVASVIADNNFIGGAGHDTLSYAGATESVTIDLTTGTATGAQIGTDAFSGIEEFVGGIGDDTIIVGAGAVTLDGNAGNDMFVFLTDTSLTEESHGDQTIKNFEVGDLVRMSKYDIFERAINELEDAFKEAYDVDSSGHGSNGVDMDDVVIPIRIRHETIEDHMSTYIEADFNGDSVFEVSIQLDGNHDLIIVNNNTPGA